MPQVDGIQRWAYRVLNYDLSECWPPSELFNLVLVFNVDELDGMYPRLPFPESWRGRLPEGLYSKWLSTRLILTEDEPVRTFPQPTLIDGQIRYVEKDVGLQLTPIMRYPLAVSPEGTTQISWADRKPPIVSLEEGTAATFLP